MCIVHLKSLYCFLEGSDRTERESFVAGIYRCVSSQTLTVSSAEKNVLGLSVGNNNKKILSISFIWKVMPRAVVLESKKSGFISMRVRYTLECLSRKSTLRKCIAQKVVLLLTATVQGKPSALWKSLWVFLK